MSKTAASACQVIQSHFFGVLSTYSWAHEGYPFGSVVPFCLDGDGLPLILISALAQHTKNIQAHPKVSLTLLESGSASVQEAERLTLLADAAEVPEAEIDVCAQRYYAHFPEARGFHDQLDFYFYRLMPVQIRFIEGFGKAHWLTVENVIQPNPFSWEQESRMVGHMNEDHADAIVHYCDVYKIPYTEQPIMCALAVGGMVLRVDGQLHWLEFPQSVSTSKDARETLVALARQPLE